MHPEMGTQHVKYLLIGGGLAGSTAAQAINHAGENDLLRDLVGKRVRVEGHEESLKDPASPLASLL